MSKQLLLSPFPLLLIFLCCPIVFSQSPAQAPVAQSPPQAPVAQPPAQAPIAQALVPTPVVQSGPTNITAILEKAGHFITLIRLLKSTQLDTEVFKRLNNSRQSLTMFAPTDNAFGSLSTGALNSYNDQQKFQLIKFHLISSFLSLPAFQTVSNPVSTEAGSNKLYPLNITTVGSQVNISSGIVNTTISGTVYTDNQLAIYQVDQVLLPLYFFATPSPSSSPVPAPPSKPEKEAPAPSGSGSSTTDADATIKSSGAMRLIHHPLNAMSIIGFLFAAFSLCI